MPHLSPHAVLLPHHDSFPYTNIIPWQKRPSTAYTPSKTFTSHVLPGIISQPTSSIPPLTACRTLVDTLAQPSLDTYYLVRRLGPHPPCTGPRRPIGRKRSGRLTRSWRHCRLRHNLLQGRWSMKPVLSPARRWCTASATRLSTSPTQARARPKGPCFHRANNCFCSHLSRTILQCVAIGLARGRGGKWGSCRGPTRNPQNMPAALLQMQTSQRVCL